MRRTLIISLIVIVAIMGGWYFSLGRPATDHIARLDKEIQAEAGKLKAYQDALASFNDRIQEYNRVDSALERQSIPYSGKDEVIALYHVLDSLCHRPGYKLNEITPSVEEVITFLRQWTRADSTISIPIRIKIEADYKILARLVKEIERGEYFENLRDCRIYGSETLYPRCGLDLTFVAGLTNRLEMFDLE